MGELRLGDLKSVLGAGAFSEVVVSLEHSGEAVAAIVLEGPTACDLHRRPVALGVQQVALPSSDPSQFGIDALQRLRENRSHELMTILTDRLVGTPTIELLGTKVPISDGIVHVACEDCVMRQI